MTTKDYQEASLRLNAFSRIVSAEINKCWLREIEAYEHDYISRLLIKKMNNQTPSPKINSLDQEVFVFPRVYHVVNGATEIVETFVRKKHKGKWYIQKFYRESRVSNFAASHGHKHDDIMSRLIYDVYFFLELGKVMPTVRMANGLVINQLDINQEDETDRIKRIYLNTPENEKTS